MSSDRFEGKPAADLAAFRIVPAADGIPWGDAIAAVPVEQINAAQMEIARAAGRSPLPGLAAASRGPGLEPAPAAARDNRAARRRAASELRKRGR
jgi:hypothetical protein